MRPNIGIVGMMLLLCLAGTAIGQDEQPVKATKSIAITFNELPAAETFGEVHPEAINFLILQSLKKHEVKATGFVVGVNLENQYDLIGQWLNDGHAIGSMTYNYEDLNDLGYQKFIEEVSMGEAELEPMLENFGQKKRYFRFPFLHYGADKESKRQVKGYLQSQNTVIAHASVVPDDQMYNYTLNKMGKVLDSLQYVVLRDEYFNSVFDELERAEVMAQDVAGHQVKQILMLQANRLNAIYLDELLTALEEAGYKFVTLDAALRDDVYAQSESYYGLRGVGYLDMLALEE